MIPPDLDGVARALARARALGVLGPGDVEEHVRHSLGFAEVIGASSPPRFLDLGSGGGVPGLVLAAFWPESTGVLLESSRRRASLLADAVARLGWSGRIEVVNGRAEVAARHAGLREEFDVVTARSFAPPPVTAECGLPFLEPCGRLIVAEPPVPDRSRWPADSLAVLGADVTWARGGDRLFAVLRRSGPLAAEVPRSWRAMARAPAW